MINGGPHPNGCTNEVCKVIANELKAEGIDSEIVCIGNDVKGCNDCHVCRDTKSELCSIGDIATQCSLKIRDCDGIIFGSPVYCGGMTGQLKAFLDRMSFSGTSFKGKAVGAFVVLRRNGSSATFKELYSMVCNRGGIAVPGSGGNTIYGHRDPNEIYQDLEGLPAMKNLGRNMAWLLKLLNDTKDTHPMPESYPPGRLNMVR